MGLAQLADAVAEDVPPENLLIEVGEQDAAGELGEVGVALDEGLGVEEDGLAEVSLGEFVEDGAPEFRLDLGGGKAKVEAECGVLDARAEVGAVPEEGGAVGAADADKDGLFGGGGRGKFGGALFGAAGAVEDVGLRSLEVAGLHEFLLHHVLDVLDVDQGLAAFADALGDGAGDLHGGGAVEAEGEEGFADGDFDFVLFPGDELAIAAEELGGEGGMGAGFGKGVLGAVGDEGAREVEGLLADEGLFDGEVEVLAGEAVLAAFFGEGGDEVGDLGGDVGDEAAVFLAVDVAFLFAGEEEGGESVADDLGDVAGRELLFSAGGGEDQAGGGSGGGDGLRPVEAGGGFAAAVGGLFEELVFFERRGADHGMLGSGVGSGGFRVRRR